MSKCLGKAENRRGEVARKEMQHTGETGGGREKRQQLKLIVQRDDVKLILEAAKSSDFGERQSWILNSSALRRYTSSLSLRFLICKMRIKRAPDGGVAERIR